MRLIHLADYGGPYTGSFIPMLHAVLSAGRSRGWPVEAVFSQTAEQYDWLHEFTDDDIPVRFVPTDSRRKLHTWLIDLLNESVEPTILHTHFTAFDIAAATASRRRKDTAVFWHVHSFLHANPIARIRNIVKYAFAGRLVSGILCVTPEIATNVKRRLGPADRVMFFHNAIDTDRFPMIDKAQRSSARTELGLPDGPRILMHFGWYWYAKGGELFLESVKLLLDQEDEEIVAVTIGGGDLAKNLGKEIGLSDSLYVLKPIESVQSLYAAADLFVSTSHSEGMPFSVMEALSSGLPVVATDIPGHASIGKELEACRLTSIEPRAVADGVRTMLGRDSESTQEATDTARRWVVDHMDISVWSERLIDLYERTLSKPS